MDLSCCYLDTQAVLLEQILYSAGVFFTAGLGQLKILPPRLCGSSEHWGYFITIFKRLLSLMLLPVTLGKSLLSKNCQMKKFNYYKIIHSWGKY